VILVRTTEVFVEQVLIGLLVLAIVALPVVNWRCIDLNGTNTIVGGAGIIALAYLLGIAFDRFADTLLSRPEQYKKLRYAKDEKSKTRKKQEKVVDYYPEEDVRANIWQEGHKIADYMEYLRSRIRLSRSLAVFTPALTISVLLASRRDFEGNPQAAVWLGMVALVYIIGFIDILSEHSWKGVWRLKKLEKTKDKYFLLSLRDFKGLREPTTYIPILLAVLAIIVVIRSSMEVPDCSMKYVTIFVIGAAFSALSAWSWWRIYKTFMEFLMSYHKKNAKKEKEDGQ
jgi:hypothetical protein